MVQWLRIPTERGPAAKQVKWDDLILAEISEAWPDVRLPSSLRPKPRPEEELESLRSKLQLLEDENAQRLVRIELLSTRNRELSQEVSRWVRAHDQMQAQNDRQHREFCLLNTSSKQQNDRLLDALLAGKEGRTFFVEVYSGYVTESGPEGVTVVYETDDDAITHRYNAGQFKKNGLPEVGQKLSTRVIVEASDPTSDEGVADLNFGEEDSGELIRESREF